MYAVDEKGRVNLPAKLRKYVSPECNDTFVLTRGFEKCLYVYPVDEWNRLEQNLRNLSSYDAEHRRFMRTLLELEGLREWRPGRTTGFAQLERAVQEALRQLAAKPVQRATTEPPSPTWGKRIKPITP